MLDLISDKENDPLDNLLRHENFLELLENIKKRLSSLELKVLEYMLDGFNYQQIALMLEKSPKQIDNAMQRLKNKTKEVVEMMKNT